ncbi:MAG: single-stranded-DNA-specific exonuclease RecJ, partial [Mailhella sp.]|nr:single-stranded-DNA-specific exonuclease RecJ [Mailhella sp.]
EAHAEDPAFVIAGGGWNQEVIGIVASRIVDRFNKPVLVLCRDGESLKGSGRSIESFDLHAGLAQCAGDLRGFGGHRMAAGIRVLPEKLNAFREHFLGVVREALGTDPVPPVQRLDGDQDFRAASDFTFLKELEMLQPFGTGNPEPVFLSPPVLVRRVRHFGVQNSHALLELTDEQYGITLKAKAWRQADRFGAELEGKRLRIAYSPCIDMYNGVASVDVKIRDWRQDDGKSPMMCPKEAGK